MSQTPSVQGVVSLVIAITGHRDLYPEDYGELQEEIKRIFIDEQAKYPDTKLLLLSGLAEGADRIAVRAAQSLTEPIPYMAVLPMKLDLYETDFKSEDSVADFRKLLAEAKEIVVMPPVNGASEEEIRYDLAVRNRQYECLGEFLVNASQIVIAVWNMKNMGKPGGTSEVVNLKLGKKQRSGRITFARVNGSGAGPVHVVLARRKQGGEGMPVGVKSKVEYPKGTSSKDFEESYKLLDRYNGDIKAGKVSYKEVEKSREGLCEGQQVTVPSAAMDWVEGVYSWANALAIRAQKRTLWFWNIVFSLLALGGLALGLTRIFESGVSALVVYYVALIAALTIILLVKKARIRTRHEDYRALAEALRVQYFWLAAGLREMASEKYLRKQAGEMIWIRDAMSECALYNNLEKAAPLSGTDALARLDFARIWVRGQADYYRRTGLKYQRKKLICDVMAYVLMGIGFVLPLLGWLGPHFGIVGVDRTHANTFEADCHAIANVMLIWASLVWNYCELRGFMRWALQYARMRDFFRAADSLLEDFENVPSGRRLDFAKETISDLGEEALSENGDWLAMHRERDLSAALASG